jgi:bifunctional NMN adenylyltransferase/nudix hydrolase
MQPVSPPLTEVGVIIARFQSPYLHEAHLDLIQSVCNRHEKVLIFLGIPAIKGTMEDPLDFEARKQMILNSFPHVIVLCQKETKCDKVWSKKLDETIGDVVTANQKVTLYGGRDSFIPSYSGKHPTIEFTADKVVSASEIRKKIAAKCVNSEEFRMGVVWASHDRYPTVYTTVDIAVFNEDGAKILLGRKQHENKFRFIGGFSDVGSNCFEEDARREVMEETGIEISDPVYVGSFRINDWRYRRSKNKITTMFFKAKHVFGKPVANDDIEEVRWFDFAELTANDIVEEHGVLLGALKK